MLLGVERPGVPRGADEESAAPQQTFAVFACLVQGEKQRGQRQGMAERMG